MTVAWVVLIAVGSALVGVAGTILLVIPPVLRRIRRDNAAHRAQLEEGIRRALAVHVVELPAPQVRHLRLVSSMGRLVSAAVLAALVEARHSLAVVRSHPVQTAAAASVAAAVVTTSLALIPYERPASVPDASVSHAPPVAPQLPRQTVPDRHVTREPAPSPSSGPEEPPPSAESAAHRPATEDDTRARVDDPAPEPDQPDVPAPAEPTTPEDQPSDPSNDPPPDEPAPDDDPPIEVGCDDDPGLCVNVDVGDVLAAEVMLGLPSPDSQSRIYAPASRTSRYAVTA